MGFNFREAARNLQFSHQEQQTGGTKFPEKHTLRVTDADTRWAGGHVDYFPPKRKGGPVHIDNLSSNTDFPGAGSALMNEVQNRHPDSTIKFLHEQKRDHNTPSHTNSSHGEPTDWDIWHKGVEYDGIHRGFAMRVQPHHADTLNSSRSKEEHLQALHEAMPEGARMGMHWTSDGERAKSFAHSGVMDPRTDIPVVLHAKGPARKDIETRPDQLFRNGVFPYDHVSREREVPIRRGRQVEVTGMSWKPDAEHPDADRNGWVHHTYDEGQPKRHTALFVMAVDEEESDVDVDGRGSDMVESTGPDPAEGTLDEATPASCSYCGCSAFKDLTDNGRVRQATCKACGGTMSAHEGAQWTPELIGDPSNHPKPNPDPASGGVGGAAAASTDSLVRDQSRLSMWHFATPEDDEGVKAKGLPLLHPNDSVEERTHKLTQHYSHLHDDNSEDQDYDEGYHPLNGHHEEHGVPYFKRLAQLERPPADLGHVAARFSKHIQKSPPKRQPMLDISDSMGMGDGVYGLTHYSEPKISIHHLLAAHPERKEFQEGEEGWFTKKHNTSMLDHITAHEYGHLKDDQHHEDDDHARHELFHKISQHIPGASPYPGVNPGKWVKNNREHIVNHVSTYGATDDHELVAELYAEHHHSPSPSKAAQVVGHHFDGDGHDDHGSAESREAASVAGGTAPEGSHSGSGAGHHEGQEPSSGAFRGRLAVVDWCAHRHASRCNYPGDSTAVSMAIPQDRGPCPWTTAWEQQVCPISEPGPMALMQAKGSIPAGPCDTCKGKGTVSWQDMDPDWEGDSDDNPGKVFTAKCDDCDGKGHVPEISDEEMTRMKNESDERQLVRQQQVSKHIRAEHPDRSKPPTWDEVKTCPYSCPVAREYGRNRHGQLQVTALSWDDIGDRHPHVYGDSEIHGDAANGADGPGIGSAANYLAHERPGHQDVEENTVHDLDFHEQTVHPRHIDYSPSGVDDPRVTRARQGYREHPHEMPPLVLVKRHNVYQVADGHHRAEAAHGLDMPVKAYVADSPHPDAPFNDGEKGPFHRAKPIPKERAPRAPKPKPYDPDQLKLFGSADDDYRMQHQAPDADYGAPLHDVEGMMPGFHEHPEHFHAGQEDFWHSANVIRGAKGNPEKKIKIYRSLPAEHAGKGFNTGDWVSTSKDYARTHGKHHEDSKHDWPVISTTVPAKHLHTEGDVHEWGYNGPPKPGSVAFKGGHHQEISQRADGSVRPVQRKAKSPERQTADTLKENGYSFSHYRPPAHAENGEHQIAAYDPDDNWAGMIRGRGDGSVHHVEIDPEHQHMPLEQHMRNMLKRGSVSAALSVPQAYELAKVARQDPEMAFHVTAAWADVRNKAKRIRAEGGVMIKVATSEGLAGVVVGDNGPYDNMITYRPGTRKIADWSCDCKWGEWAWDRIRFHGRQCSHSLALQYEAQSRGMFGKEVHLGALKFGSVEEPDERSGLTDVPISLVAKSMTDAEADPAEIMKVLMAYGLTHSAANVLLQETLFSVKESSIQVEADQGKMCQQCGHMLDEDAKRCPICSAEVQDNFKDTFHDAALHTAESDEDKRRKKHHRTNDTRRHAPNFGYGIPGWIGLPIGQCGQCSGWGCGHCGGTGQVAQDGHGNTADAVPDQNGDEGQMMSGGISDTSSLRTAATDWAQAHAEIGPEIHRGMMIDLGHPEADDIVHDRLVPNHERARVIHDALQGKGLGKHWTDDQGIAEHYSHPNVASEYGGQDHGPFTARVVLHAEKPHLHEIENNPQALQQGDAYDFHNHVGEREIPLKQDAPVRLKGVSWFDGRWNRHDFDQAQPHTASKQDGPTVSGVALKAADTGRVLMLQRGLGENHPAAGKWEFPGGHHEDGDTTSLHAAVREWQEEVGQPFPEGGVVHHTWTSPDGGYQGHVVVIPSEKDLAMHQGRVVPNPDDPKGDEHEQAAWWDISHAKGNKVMRDEVKAHTPWNDIARAGTEKTASSWDALSGEDDTPGFPYAAPLHSNSQNPASTGWATSEDPKSWNNQDEIPDHLLPSGSYDGGSYYGMLHDEPEGALPSTDGAEETGYKPPETQSSIPDNDGSLSPNQFTGSVNDIVSAFQATAGAKGIMSDTPAKPQTGGEMSFDYTAAARQYLAEDKGLRKSALKDFSFPEQQELINEGKREDSRARNFGSLQIEGTHYEALNRALGLDNEDPEELFT